MTQKKRNDLKYALALALLKKLWVDGLITEDELQKIDARNKASFYKKAA